MPRPRFEKLPIERKQAILEAAARELAAKGFEKASLNRILEQAGMSKGAAYYYFDDKADLVATVFTYIWKKVLADTDLDLDTLSTETFWPKIRDLAHQFMAATDEQPWLLSAAKAIWGLPPGKRNEGSLGEAFQAVFGWFASFIQKGRSLGVIRTDLPEDLLIAMAIAVDEAADRWLLANFDTLTPEELSNHVEVIFGIWRNLLSPPEGSSK